MPAPPPPMPAPPPPPAPPAPQPKPKQCAPELKPHLFVLPNSIVITSTSGQTWTHQYLPSLSPTNSTTFTYPIPTAWSSKTCSLIFTWPTKDKLQTSDYWVSGSGALSFAKADGEGAGVELGRVQPATEGRYVIWSGVCEAGKEVRFRGSSVGGVDLRWFQDYNPEPIGLWVVAC
ncbi:ubiquitin 3 binding protein But2 C-terminal domain-containing protein [Elsinoe ampelina]|uniref:Ubiquitin 3 binding protein But2 C-terminal domain-containing protein n=1 Tax=Elsinoe ampelina TaxID=302913 RepID=A0A6A6GDG8_9PEZI|nr:ubiquitin 3 binding protein But2 C-terminal domain-containing protein [Elsinoe ampelina]